MSAVRAPNPRPPGEVPQSGEEGPSQNARDSAQPLSRLLLFGPSPSALRAATSPGGRGPETGFTLIELMVALAVFALIGLTLLKLQGAIIKNSGEIATQAVGQIVAHNLAVDTLTDPRAPSIGSDEGAETNGGQSWRWTRVTSMTADPALVRIDITVLDQAGRPAGKLSLARPVQ